MGLIETPGAVSRPTAAAADPFFVSINDELADKGFLVTSTDDLINWARTGSLMWMTFGLQLLQKRIWTSLHQIHERKA